MQFYRILDDINYNNRWFLGSIPDLTDIWKYTSATRIEPPVSTIPISLRTEGLHMDFTFADFELPIINEKCRRLLPANEIQVLPVTLPAHVKKENSYILIIIHEIECVDEANSEYSKFDYNDSVRPDKSGEFRSFSKLIIDPSKVIGANIFRIKRFNNAIIISQYLKDILEMNAITGIIFQNVTVNKPM